ncbi:MAG TPA: ABC transporter substrate-binding protein [Acidimicrobiales bacterium]
MAWRGRFAVVLLAAALVAQACGGGGSGSGDEGAPAEGGSLRVAVGEDIWPLTGRGPSSKAFAAGEVNVNVYEPLLALGADYTVRPGLAERWELVDPTTWRFWLRPGVRFHDGRPFGADDVVWSWSRQFLPTAVTRNLSAVHKVDDLTVDFVMMAPNLRLPEQLVHPEGPIVPGNGHNDDQPPVGTGPYRVVEYVPRQRVVVQRFDGYWGEKAQVSPLTFVFMPDPAERVEAIEAGDVDVASVAPFAAVPASVRVVKAAPGLLHQLSFNMTGSPPSDLTAELAVRQAVALSLDRTRYVADVLAGNGEPGRWLAPPAVLGASASLVAPPVLDVARARDVLDGAGWRPGGDGVRTRGGRRLTLTAIGGPNVSEPGLRFVQSQLAAVGIEVAVKKASDTVTYEEYRDRLYDLDLTAPNQNDANPAFLVTGRAGEDQVQAVAAAAGREDVQRRAAEITRGAGHEEYRVVPLAVASRAYALRDGVELAVAHPSAINQPWTALSTR